MTMAGAMDSMKKTGVTIAAIAWWTIIDEFRQRSVLILFAACAAFLFVTRGCYQGSYVVNGEALDAATIVSQATFHVVAAGVMMLAALMAMRIFKRERDDGTQAYLLSRPIARWHYLAGKVAGLWLGSTASMLALHGVLCLMAFLSAHAVSPGYLTASLLCSVNLLLVVLAVMALSLWIPDSWRSWPSWGWGLSVLSDTAWKPRRRIPWSSRRCSSRARRERTAYHGGKRRGSSGRSSGAFR